MVKTSWGPPRTGREPPCSSYLSTLRHWPTLCVLPSQKEDKHTHFPEAPASMGCSFRRSEVLPKT